MQEGAHSSICLLDFPVFNLASALTSPNSPSIVHDGLTLGENRVNSALANSACSVCLPQIFVKYSIWSMTLSSETTARIPCAIVGIQMSSKRTCVRGLALR